MAPEASNACSSFCLWYDIGDAQSPVDLKRQLSSLLTHSCTVPPVCLIVAVSPDGTSNYNHSLASLLHFCLKCSLGRHEHGVKDCAFYKICFKPSFRGTQCRICQLLLVKNTIIIPQLNKGDRERRWSSKL